MKTTRRITSIQHAGKEICVYSNGSDCTDSSEKEKKASTKTSRGNKWDLGTISTKFTEVATKTLVKNQVSPTQNDIEMEPEKETGFSFDSIMSTEEMTTHEKVISEYGRDIIDNLKKSEITMIGNLDKHEIKGSHRKQMVVWMEEVLSIFKCPLDTFFMAVQILDRYLELSKSNLVLSELHEIGIVSMFIASKYQEVEPLTIDLMINKIAHGKITEKTIMKREKKILCTLKFKLGTPNVLNFIDSYIEIFASKVESDDKEEIKKLAIQIAKNGISDRRIAFTMLTSELALCSIIIAIKNHSKIVKKTILTSEFSKLIKDELTSDESLVLQFGKRLRKLAVEPIF